MTLKNPYILIIFFELAFLGCSSNSKQPHEMKLIGTWVLDSVSTPRGHYFKETSCSRTLIFKNKSDYSYEWRNADVGNTFTGKYFLLDNLKRGLKTVSFIPDIQLDGKDTIRISYMNFDILSLTTSRLQVIDETEFIKRDSLPYIRFSKIYIYKRSK
jgi:hypothetical protein